MRKKDNTDIQKNKNKPKKAYNRKQKRKKYTREVMYKIDTLKMSKKIKQENTYVKKD